MIITGNIYAGLAPGGASTASQGVQIVGSDIQLGGNPITKFVGIALNGAGVAELTIGDPINIWGFDIVAAGADPADVVITLSSADNGAAPTTASSLVVSKSIVQSNIFNSVFDTQYSQSASGFSWTLNNPGPGASFSIDMLDSTLLGYLTCIIHDSNGIGLQKDSSILSSSQLANPNAYVTTDCLGAVLVAKLNQLNQTALNTVFNLYAVSATFDQLLRINPNVYISSGASMTGFSAVLNYTDRGGVVRNVTLALIPSPAATESPTIPAQVIYAQKSTLVTITVSFSAGPGIYDIHATCEYLGIEN